MRLLIGTDDGLQELADGEPRRLREGKVTHLATGEGTGVWAIVDDAVERWHDGRWEPLGGKLGHVPRSLLGADDALYIGAARAHLYVVRGESVELVEGFESAGGRDTWHTPWGGPPDVRSLARDHDGTLYANVHVGGVLRSTDGLAWQPTMDIGADVHQVAAHPELAGCVLVASAWGLGLSFDGARTWGFTGDGLHSNYCRAVATAGNWLLISASDGPRGGRGSIYRRPLSGDWPLEKCTHGLPEWFDGNIDSGCLVAAGEEIAFGTADGEVFVSADAGANWWNAATVTRPIRALEAGSRWSS